MPFRLRKKVLEHMFDDFVEYFELLFSKCELMFIYEFVTKLVPHQYQSLETVIGADRPVSSMFLITLGRIVVSYKGLKF